MLIKPDMRRFEEPAEAYGHCRKCGSPLTLLPDDMRMGYCFDCINFLEISRKQELNEGRFMSVHELCHH